MGWTITIEGRNEFGGMCRDLGESNGDIGLSIGGGKKIMAALQSAVGHFGAGPSLSPRHRTTRRHQDGLASPTELVQHSIGEIASLTPPS